MTNRGDARVRVACAKVVDDGPLTGAVPRRLRITLPGLVTAAILVVHSPSLALAAPSASLPDWDAAKKKKSAPLPDWDAAKPKKDPKQAKPKKPKKPSEAPAEAPAEAPSEAPAEAPVEAPAEAPVEAGGDASAPVAAPPEPEPAPAPAPVAEGPAPAPGVDVGAKELARAARGELIVGGVLLGLGVGGIGMIGAGAAIKGKADASDDDVKTGTTLLGAGAIVGVIGTVMGLALLGEGVKDRKAARAGQTARVRVGPTLGGLVLSGRF